MAVIDGLGDAPQYFAHNAKLNRSGPPPVDWSEEMPASLTPEQARDYQDKGAWLIDVRDTKEFASGHFAGAVNIGIRGRFETWVGIMVPWEATFILIGSDEEIKEATFRLHRIGYDSPTGYLKWGTTEQEKAGLPTQKVNLVAPVDLYKQMQEGSAPIIIDVRLPAEWMALRIGNVLNMPLDKLFKEASRLDPEMPVLMVCNSAYRSSMAASIMQKLNFKDVHHLDGGTQDWIEAGLPTYGSDKKREPEAAGVYVKLPERMSPEDLAQRLMDLPETIEVVDIRPPWQFEEYHLTDSKNLSIQELMTNPAYLADKRPLVIVCRDGSLSAAVGGALVQKSSRPIRYLSGGVMRYYDEIMRPQGILSDRTPSGGPSRPSKVPGVSGQEHKALERIPSAPVAPQPPTKKKPSAGC
jgi:rhodanese-related sulfurtransferase